MKTSKKKYPAGVQPYDTMNGARVGAIVGGFAAIGALWLTGGALVWLLPVIVVLGGVIGYAWQRREQARTRSRKR